MNWNYWVQLFYDLVGYDPDEKERMDRQFQDVLRYKKSRDYTEKR